MLSDLPFWIVVVGLVLLVVGTLPFAGSTSAPIRGGWPPRSSFGTAMLAVILENRLAVASAGSAFAQEFAWAIGFALIALVAAFWLPATRQPSPATA